MARHGLSITALFANGRQARASLEAWFLAILSEFPSATQARIADRAEKIDADARIAIPKQIQVIGAPSIMMPNGRRT
jgi:hypothetical protein